MRINNENRDSTILLTAANKTRNPELEGILRSLNSLIKLGKKEPLVKVREYTRDLVRATMPKPVPTESIKLKELKENLSKLSIIDLRYSDISHHEFTKLNQENIEKMNAGEGTGFTKTFFEHPEYSDNVINFDGIFNSKEDSEVLAKLNEYIQNTANTDELINEFGEEAYRELKDLFKFLNMIKNGEFTAKENIKNDPLAEVSIIVNTEDGKSRSISLADTVIKS